jgi:ApaG protein
MNRLSKSNIILENNQNITQLKPYSKTTNNVVIDVWPEFVDSKSGALGDLFIWAYHIIITNKNDFAIKLTNRHWKITDAIGIVQEVDGEGVVGDQPTILPNNSYKYSSGVHLNFPSGIMSGSYRMQKINGEIFDVEIPLFSLDIPNHKEKIN